MRRISGLAASPGIAIGPVLQFGQVVLPVGRRDVEDTSAEWSRLELALSRATGELEQVRLRAESEIGKDEAAIFVAQQSMLRDPELLSLVKRTLERDRLSAEAAWHDSTEHFAKQLERMENEYLRARAADVIDMSRRVLRALLGVSGPAHASPSQPSIICAEDLSPSDTIGLDRSMVLGFCTARGGETSHTAILARSLGLPAVVGAGVEVVDLHDGQKVILDGAEGEILTDPTDQAVREYMLRRDTERATTLEALSQRDRPAVTLDGHRIEVLANIGDMADAHVALESGAEGVGLLRTEFLYMHRSSIPDEEEQYRAYRGILLTLGRRTVILRTLDIGGDKPLSYLAQAKEGNPFLGVRGIRLCLAQPDLLKPQLRAALRAGEGYHLKLMFPMIAIPDELRRARILLEECRAELEREGAGIAEAVEVGIMVEVPSAALMADRLATDVDFFSIGTNDLTQYTLAADRTHAGVSALCSSYSPAVLRLIHGVVQAAHREHKPVGVCGELAGDVKAVPLLLGLGVDELSMNPPAIPGVKMAIRSLSMDRCRAKANAALALEDANAVRRMLALGDGG